MDRFRYLNIHTKAFENGLAELNTTNIIVEA